MKSGIYIIANSTNLKCYIGSTNNFIGRFNHHIRELNLNIHSNKYLQYAWNKYGGDDFLFYALEEVLDLTRLIEREQYFLDLYKAYDRDCGYNINIIADRPTGKNYDLAYKLRMSFTLKGRIKSPEWQNNIKIGIQNSEKNFVNKPNKEKWPHTRRCKCDGCKLRISFYNRDNNIRKKILHQYSLEAI